MIGHEFPGELGSTLTPLPPQRSGASGSPWPISPWPRRGGPWRTAGAQRGPRRQALTPRSTGGRPGSPKRSTWGAAKKTFKKGGDWESVKVGDAGMLGCHI